MGGGLAWSSMSPVPALALGLGAAPIIGSGACVRGAEASPCTAHNFPNLPTLADCYSSSH